MVWTMTAFDYKLVDYAFSELDKNKEASVWGLIYGRGDRHSRPGNN
jgi:hypothetical protein